MHYKISGSGPALLLLHGFLESNSIWAEIEEKVSLFTTTIVIDLPGHGKSESLGPQQTITDIAHALEALLSSHQIEKIHLLGHSMGGYVALAFAEFFPNRVNSLTLLNSTSLADSDERKENRMRALQLLDTHKNAFVSMAIGNLFSEEAKIRFKPEIRLLKDKALQFSSEGIKASINCMMNRPNRTNVLKNFTKTKTVICGVDDPIVPIKASEELALATQSRLIRLKGGHMSLSLIHI